MSLTPGTRLGPYEVVGSLGAGGMGEVYRARDPKLGRDVALKILPDTFANDPERLARFEREAKTLASLNHPHSQIVRRTVQQSWSFRAGPRTDPNNQSPARLHTRPPQAGWVPNSRPNRATLPSRWRDPCRYIGERAAAFCVR